mgnify:CR=1 FL=1
MRDYVPGDSMRRIHWRQTAHHGQFMVKEFDQVVFSGEVGKVHGPVKTQFGYHLLEITSRTD